MKVECVAIREAAGIWILPPPARHHDVIREMVTCGVGKPAISAAEQGFLLEDGTFVDRKTAAEFAVDSGQVENLIAPPSLFSEDLW